MMPFCNLLIALLSYLTAYILPLAKRCFFDNVRYTVNLSALI